MAALRTPLYKEYLTPALHRRFTNAAVIVFGFCYVEAVLIGDRSSYLWAWFPIGPAGIRALLLFISSLSIFVLRVAQLHLGERTTLSPFTTFTQYLLRFNTLQTLAWYLFSAWWFSEVYVWSAPVSADLGWVAQGKSWERKKLNERPIYLRSVFFMFAVLQSGLHLYRDYDKISLPITTKQVEYVSPKPAHLRAWLVARSKPLLPLFLFNAATIYESALRNIGLRTLWGSLVAPFIYSLFVRRTAWDWSLALAALLWDVPASQLSFILPHYPSLVYRTLTSGVLLIFLWESSNAYFTAYVAQEPIKKTQPFTSESKDPNGTLLIGLKSKKEIPKTFAFWELAFITQSFEARRKAIFTDIDRPSDSTWNQIMILCLNNIINISSRITSFKTPTPSATQQPTQPANIEYLPRLSAPLRQENILTNPPPPDSKVEKIESGVGRLTKSYGQSSSPGTLKIPYTPEAKKIVYTESQKLLESTKQNLLTSGAHGTPTTPASFRALIDDYIMRFLRTPLGKPFRQTFHRRICTVVLGTPYSELHMIISSIKSLSALALASLTEDPYGKVAKDIPTLIRAYVSIIQTTEGFVAETPPHWTDVEFMESDRKIEEVEMVLECLRDGLRDMVEGFGRYAGELGLSGDEVRISRKVAGMEKE